MRNGVASVRAAAAPMPGRAAREASMRDDESKGFLLPAGPIAAIVLGMALTPFRELTNSANFIFVFMILIIVVSEFGGRWAAILTATCSALSLNFFLTRPYLSLRIEGKHDVIAFLGLTICGIVAAALGTRRSGAAAALGGSRALLEMVHEVAVLAGTPGPVAPRLEDALRHCRDRLPLVGLVVRDARGEVIAASGRPPSARPAPVVKLRPDLLVASGEGLPLPVEGGSLALEAGGRQVGWLDLWGDRTPASSETRRAISDVARLFAIMIAG